MGYKHLLYEKEDGIGLVTINRPEVLNLLNTEVFAEVFKLFQEIEDDPEVGVVILTGSGPKAFVAGVDVGEMKDKNSRDIEAFVAIARKAGDRIFSLSKPVIAAVNGFALGGGWEMAMNCDLIIAAENARFGQPEITLGIVPGGGAMQKLARTVGLTRAKELVFTGDIIDADRALALGLVNKVVPAESLMTEAKNLAKKLLSRSGVALSFAKKALNSGGGLSLDAAVDIDEAFFKRCFDTADQKEGMKAFLEKRKPRFKNK